MKRNKASVDVSLNDSDDSTVHFKNPILKRKPTVKTSSPSRKRTKVEALHKSTASTSSKLMKVSGTVLKKKVSCSIDKTAQESVSDANKQEEFVINEGNSGFQNVTKGSESPSEIHSKSGASSEKTVEFDTEKTSIESPCNKKIESEATKISDMIEVAEKQLQEPELPNCSPEAIPPNNQVTPSPSTSTNLKGSATSNVSEFFALRKTNKKSCEVLMCPLCLKTFENKPAHLSHMKQCAKKKKMSTAELLEAIDQKKKSPTTTLTFGQKSSAIEKKTIKEAEKVEVNDALAVAIAMSVSESTNSSRPYTIDKSVVASQKVTLERFGFTATGAASSYGIRRGRANTKRQTVLRSRTPEERIKLLTEKAAVVLLSEEIQCPPVALDRTSQDEHLQFQVSEPTLWDLGESEKGGSWYLSNLKENLETELLPSSSRASIDSVSTVDIDHQDVQTLDASPLEESFPATGINETHGGSQIVSDVEDRGNEDMRTILAKLTLPLNTLSADWQKMVNNELESDLAVTTFDRQLHIHSLVLKTRCPSFLEVDYQEAFRTVTSSSALVFLNFIYTGMIGKFSREDLPYLTHLAKFFKYSPLIEITSALNRAQNGSGSSDDLFIPNTPKKECSAIGHSRSGVTAVRMVADNSEPHKRSPKPADEADTVPVNAFSMEVDEVSIIPQEEQRRVSELVDLTLNLSPRSCEDDIESAERSYWSLLKHERQKEEEEQRQREEEKMESIEWARERAKIDSFIQSQTERNQSIAENLEKEELEESLKEREKIYRLSRSSEQDLFEDAEEIEEVPQLQPTTSHPDEIIIVSSDEEKNDFDVSTDEDNTELVIKSENVALPPFLDLPHDPPNYEFEDLLDYFPSDGVLAMSPLQSQSFVKSVVSPRTPKRVLGKQPSPANSPAGSSTPASSDKEAKINRKYPVTPTPTPSTSKAHSDEFLQNTPCGRPSHSTGSKLEEPTEVGCVHRRRLSAAQRMGKKIVKRSRKSLLNKSRNVRHSVRKSQVEDAALSSSLIEGLNETWKEKTDETPECNRPFVEITPRQTPSVKLSDKVTPRPHFSAMKTGSIKKHLQKYGLKKSLGKVKAKKILHHIYNELHPVVNTKTGKFVKFLNTDESRKKPSKRKSTGRIDSNSGTKKRAAPSQSKRSTKAVSAKDSSLISSSSSKVLATVASSLVLKSPSKENAQRKNFAAQSCKSPAKSLASELPASYDRSSSFSSGFLDESESGSSGEEFADLEGEILTQQMESRMCMEDAINKYIKDNPELHRQVLLYHPIWAEELRRCVLAAYGAKYKLIDIMDFLDKKCITYRSEAQAANNKRRNERKKSRRSPKKKEKKKDAESL